MKTIPELWELGNSDTQVHEMFSPFELMKLKSKIYFIYFNDK